MATVSMQVVNKVTISRVLKQIQSNSHEEIFCGLKEIRKNIIKTTAGLRLFHEHGGLKSLVRFLKNPNEKTLDITLSILGNCCLDYEFRKEAGDLNISTSVISILQNINTDSIIGRACRLLGNLAQDYCVARQLHENGAVRVLLTIIPVDGHGTGSAPTRQMAVRTLGALWSVPERRGEMLRMSVVQTVAVLLTTETTPELLESVLKVLVTFTKTPSQQCAQQVNGDGSGFQYLVANISQPSLKEYALTCICNLCHVASSRPLLGNAGVIDVLIEEVKENRRPAVLQALCLLSRESGNRTKIREAGGLQILLSESRSERRCLKSLEHYVYDEPSINELLSIGLLPMLVELLAKCQRLNPSTRPFKRKRRFQSDSLLRLSPSRNLSLESFCLTSPSTSPYLSPSSSNSSPSYSLSSPSSSHYYSDQSDEENYSPVCSGEETDDEGIDKPKKEACESFDAGPILILLARISHMDKPVANMATRETLQALLDYLTLNSNPSSRAGRILSRICRNPLYFIHILLAGFVPRVHSQLLSNEYQADLGVSLLAQLSLLAESGFGEGEVAHHLLKSQQKHKETLAIAIPHLIKTPRLLKKLLLDCNGLAILMQVFERTCDYETHDSTDLKFSSASLYTLATTLNISMHAAGSNQVCGAQLTTKLEGEEVVLFNLDDGSQVSANKSLLCHRSPFFDAMFRGDFCESHQQSVNLPHLSRKCWTNVVGLLERDEITHDMDLTQALDVLKALDRFLIPSEPRITELVLRFLSAESAKLVYEQTLICGDAPIFTYLKQNTLKYILTSEMNTKVRMEMYSELLSKFGKEFVGNLECLIKTEIDNTYNRMYRMRCK